MRSQEGRAGGAQDSSSDVGSLGFPVDSYVPDPELKKLATQKCQRMRQERSQAKPALWLKAGGAAEHDRSVWTTAALAARHHGRPRGSTPSHQQGQVGNLDFHPPEAATRRPKTPLRPPRRRPRWDRRPHWPATVRCPRPPPALAPQVK